MLPLTLSDPVNVELPLTLRALVPLPVTISDPDNVPDPVNGKAPIPVNPEPSPINDPLAVPLTNKLPVTFVLPLTLSAGIKILLLVTFKEVAILFETDNDPEIDAEPVILVPPSTSKALFGVILFIPTLLVPASA